MSSYLGRHAELYDLFYAAKPYPEEAAFVHQCLQRYGSDSISHLLELACGTGEHAFALEALGYEVVAMDYSTDMLARARKKKEQRGSRVDFREGDMRSLSFPDSPFDAAICLFDSIGYVATNNALQEVLQGIARHLKAKGLFIFEFWHAGAMLPNYDPLRVRRWQTDEGEILRLSETQLQLARQTATVTYTIYELGKDGRYSSFVETQTNRYFLLQEMANWLTGAGLTPLQWYAGFIEDTEITSDTWHIVAVARKEV